MYFYKYAFLCISVKNSTLHTFNQLKPLISMNNTFYTWASFGCRTRIGRPRVYIYGDFVWDLLRVRSRKQTGEGFIMGVDLVFLRGRGSLSHRFCNRWRVGGVPEIPVEWDWWWIRWKLKIGDFLLVSFVLVLETC